MRAALVVVICLAIIGAETVARHAVTTPHGYTRAQMPAAENGTLAMSESSGYVKIRRVTDPGEPVLALPFFPDFYFFAGRLPMKGYFVYLPWDADYGKHPVLGMTNDICVDLARNPPPVIFYNGWIVWGKFDPRQYMPCVLQILAEKYAPIPGEESLYVRKDRLSRLQQ